MTRQKEPFIPLEPNKIKMYVCGVTVYDECHLGHARCEVSFDMIRRYFMQAGYHVTFVRNITDIDDKIIQRAQFNNESYSDLTARMISAMHAHYAALGVLPPDIEPKATDFVESMQQLIQRLIEASYAYVTTSGDVYYRVRRFKSYGCLSGKVIDELEVGSRVAFNHEKEDPLDFVLWKAAKPGEPAWPSVWGNGRPGWHIECSAMCQATLGDTLDIHGGGPDLKFPHHDNEIAQSEALTKKPLANMWMHVGALRVNQDKMSKSLGNFLTIKAALAEYPAEVLRYFLLSSHYRSEMQYTTDRLKEASNSLKRLYSAIQNIPCDQDKSQDSIDELCPYESVFHQAMRDDFNTPKAFAVLFDLARDINKLKKIDLQSASLLAKKLLKLSHLLGFLYHHPEKYAQGDTGIDSEWIESMIEKRKKAKQQRDFKTADHIRQVLMKKGIELLDHRDGTRWQMMK